MGFLFSSLGSRGAAGRVLVLPTISPRGSAKPGTWESGPPLGSDSEAGGAPPRCLHPCPRPPPCGRAGLPHPVTSTANSKSAGPVQRPFPAGPRGAGSGAQRGRAQTRRCGPSRRCREQERAGLSGGVRMCRHGGRMERAAARAWTGEAGWRGRGAAGSRRPGCGRARSPAGSVEGGGLEAAPARRGAPGAGLAGAEACGPGCQASVRAARCGRASRPLI